MPSVNPVDPQNGAGAQAVDWLKRALASVSAIFLFVMMVLTVVDVGGRYLVNRPLPGSFEIMQFLLALLVFSALPIVTHDRGHITVSLFDGFFRGGMRRLQQFVIFLVSAIALAIITQRMWQQGNILDETGAITGFLLWPIAPVAYAMSVLGGIACFLMLLLIWRNLRGEVFADSGGSVD